MKIVWSIIKWTFVLSAIGVMLFCGYMAITSYISSQDPEAVAHEAFDLVNSKRVELNFPPLLWDNDLESKAIAYSQTMNTTGRFEHSKMNYAECILSSSSFSNGEQVFNPWERSYKHFDILMSRDIHYAAIGIYEGYATFLGR